MLQAHNKKRKKRQKRCSIHVMYMYKWIQNTCLCTANDVVWVHLASLPWTNSYISAQHINIMLWNYAGRDPPLEPQLPFLHKVPKCNLAYKRYPCWISHKWYSIPQPSSRNSTGKFQRILGTRNCRLLAIIHREQHCKHAVHMPRMMCQRLTFL